MGRLDDLEAAQAAGVLVLCLWVRVNPGLSHVFAPTMELSFSASYGPWTAGAEHSTDLGRHLYLQKKWDPGSINDPLKVKTAT